MYDFGLTSEQFWNLTPPQFHALARRHDESMRLHDLWAALTSSTIANVYRDDKARPDSYRPKDFGLLRHETEEESEQKAISFGQRLSIGLRALYGTKPGKKNKEAKSK